MNLIQHAIDLGGGPVAFTRELNKRISKPVTYQAVLKWARQGRLPRTEWTGETSYAKAMSAVVGGKVKVRELLQKPIPCVGGVTAADAAPEVVVDDQAQGVAHG